MAWLVRWHKWLVYPTNFAVSSDTATVQIGYPYQIPYTITPANATNQKINWTSSNTSIATVDNKWIITAVFTWTCTVTWVYSYDWTTVTISVTTTEVHTTWVSLDKHSLELNEWWIDWLHATLTPSNTSYSWITWSSSDTNVATVSSTWAVKYVWWWTCTITCTTIDWWYTDTCTVSCIVPVSWIILDKHFIELTTNWTSQITATISPNNATDKLVTWSSSDTSVATVSNAWLVSYVWVWDCTITCTTTDGWFTDNCEVSCIIPVTWVTLNKSTWTIASWETISLIATITPSNATIKTVTWTSSNTWIATVSSSWVVSYVADWTATITCTTVQWWYTATCTITCENKKPVSQTFSYTWADQSYTIPYTQCYKLEAWWWGSYDAKWWYASWVMCLTKWTVLRIMVWAKGNNGWNRYWFGWSSNYSNSYDWAWLSWIFTGNTAIAATDSSRALVIWWWAGSCSGRWNGWAWWWECWASWWTSWYWTQWWWGTQSWRQSWWNVWTYQFCWWNGSWSYWAWWGWWWYWWNWTTWDGSAWDDKWAWGGSWYVKSTMTSRTLTQWWWSAAQSHWSVKISSV